MPRPSCRSWNRSRAVAAAFGVAFGPALRCAMPAGVFGPCRPRAKFGVLPCDGAMFGRAMREGLLKRGDAICGAARGAEKRGVAAICGAGAEKCGAAIRGAGAEKCAAGAEKCGAGADMCGADMWGAPPPPPPPPCLTCATAGKARAGERAIRAKILT